MAELEAGKLSAALDAIWRRHQPLVLERLALLERAAAASPLPEALRHEAAVTAHNLAGTLGMFGFTQGTDLAREIEQLLEAPHSDLAALPEFTSRLREAVFPQAGPG